MAFRQQQALTLFHSILCWGHGLFAPLLAPYCLLLPPYSPEREREVEPLPSCFSLAGLGEKKSFKWFGKGFLKDGKCKFYLSEKNKVIRPKSRTSALSKKVRQTDKHFFSKRHLKWPFVPQSFFFYHSGSCKRFRKPFKQFCDGPTDGRTEGPKCGL